MSLNRRDLMAMLTAAGASALPVAHSRSWGPQTPSWTGQPEFHVVYWFEEAPINDFIEGGIYTKAEDAQAHIDRRVAEGKGRRGSCAAGIIIKLTHEQLCFALAEKRLGPMADHLSRLMMLPAPNREGCEPADLRRLYDGTGSEYPVAVTKA